MPLRTSQQSGGQFYSSVHIGESDKVVSMEVDLSDLDTDVVDDDGYLIPGTVLQFDSGDNKLKPIDGADQTAYGVVLYPVKVVFPDEQNDTVSNLLAAKNDDDDHSIGGIMVNGVLDSAIMESNLDRNLTADEYTALDNNDALQYVKGVS